MDILIGSSTTGNRIEVPADENEPIDKLLDRHREPDERFDLLCALTYLRAREEAGWRLTAVDQGDRFRDLLLAVWQDPSTAAALADARRRNPAHSVFDDVLHGRSLVLPDLRA